jgi:two-component system, response regulator PdtaR
MTTPSKILIVEDEAIIALQMKIQLSRLGYVVCDTVGTAEQAIARARECAPDLILMDIHLHGVMSGADAMLEIRAFSQAPVIFMTGYPDEEVEESAARSQPAGYLVKPINSADLVKAVQGWVGK